MDQVESEVRRLEVLRQEHHSEGERETVVATIALPTGLAYFKGHFEGDPLLPGVVQLDGAVLAVVERTWPELVGALRRIDRLKFVAPLRPGDEIELRLVRGPARNSMTFRITKGGEPCSSGLLRFGAGPDGER